VTGPPSGWTQSTVGAVTVNFDSRRIPVKASEREKRRGPYPYFGAQGHIDDIDDYLFDGTYLLIAEDGANLLTRSQPIARVVTGRFWVNNHAHVVQADGVELRYLQHFLNGNPLRGVIRGTAQPKLTKADLNRLVIPVPPLDEQRRIVDILEDHLSRLDAARTALEHSRTRLSRLRQAMLDSILNMAELAPTCDVRSIGDIATVGTGATPLKARRDYYEGGTIPWVTSADLARGLIEEPAQFVTPLALAETNVKLFPPGTLLVAMYGEGKTRGTVGELAISATTNQACAAIQLESSDPSYRGWVRLVLEANYWRMRRLASGGVQPNLNLSLIRQIRVPLPDSGTRDSLLRARNAEDGARHQLEPVVRRAEKRQSNLRRALLNAAFSGQLASRANDLDLVEEMVGV
jgi:type I restriction enzyme, S subunit